MIDPQLDELLDAWLDRRGGDSLVGTVSACLVRDPAAARELALRARDEQLLVERLAALGEAAIAPPRRGALAVLAVAAALVLGLGGWWWLHPDDAGPAPAVELVAGSDLRTARGERRRIDLAAGGGIVLGPDSRIRVEAPRRLVLAAGEAGFELADPTAGPWRILTPVGELELRRGGLRATILDQVGVALALDAADAVLIAPDGGRRALPADGRLVLTPEAAPSGLPVPEPAPAPDPLIDDFEGADRWYRSAGRTDSLTVDRVAGPDGGRVLRLAFDHDPGSPGHEQFAQIALDIAPPPTAVGIALRARAVAGSGPAAWSLALRERDHDAWLLGATRLTTLGGDWTTVELRFTSVGKRLHDGGDGVWDPRAIERVSLGLSDGDGALEIDELRWMLAP